VGPQTCQTVTHNGEYHGTRKQEPVCWRGPRAIQQSVSPCLSRAVAQAVSRWLPIMTALVRARVKSVRSVAHKAAIGRISQSTSAFLANHSTDCSTLVIIWGWYNRSTSGLSLTPRHETNKKTRLKI
jgi:hypothetical protein